MAMNRADQLLEIKRMRLSEKTALFWSLSQASRGQGQLKGITTEKAISMLSDLESVVSTDRAIAIQTTELLDRVVGLPKRRKVAKVPATPTKAVKHRKWSDDDDGPTAA